MQVNRIRRYLMHARDLQLCMLCHTFTYHVSTSSSLGPTEMPGMGWLIWRRICLASSAAGLPPCMRFTTCSTLTTSLGRKALSFLQSISMPAYAMRSCSRRGLGDEAAAAPAVAVPGSSLGARRVHVHGYYQCRSKFVSCKTDGMFCAAFGCTACWGCVCCTVVNHIYLQPLHCTACLLVNNLTASAGLLMACATVCSRLRLVVSSSTLIRDFCPSMVMTVSCFMVLWVNLPSRSMIDLQRTFWLRQLCLLPARACKH